MFKTLYYLTSNSPIAKGKRGEWHSGLLLRFGLNWRYQVYHDVTLYTNKITQATTQIDHIVISPFGIFVIEVKNFSGFIFGGAKKTHWIQTFSNQSKNQQIKSKQYHFFNPLIQNKKHVDVVKKIFGVTNKQIFSVVVFMEKAVFKTRMPRNVMYLKDMRQYIKGFKKTLFNQEQLKGFHQKINQQRLPKGKVADTIHMAHIHKVNQRLNNKNKR